MVDGMNVIGARPDGWWRDRAGARRALVGELSALADDDTAVTVVFDGRPQGAESDPVPGVTVTFAPGGPDAADDAIVVLVEGLSDQAGTVVVTSDRTLADRVRRLGATVEGVTAFRTRLGTARDGPDGDGRGRGGRRSADGAE
ncbi:MAG: NYN domain-containing protein [Acidimicrobiales bacterium]